MKFDGVNAIVSGGASGLGEAVVRAVVESGGKATVIDLPSSNGVALAEELGQDVRFAPTDVTKADDVTSAIEAAQAHMGGIQLLVNCAGISPAERVVRRDGTLASLEVFRQTVEVNLIGLYDLVRQAAGVMAEQPPSAIGERGVIVNVASIAAFEGQVGQTAYAASKGGVVALTLPLARDLADLGIRTVTVCPGIMDTGMLAGVTPKRREALVDLHVFPKRLGAPADFALLVRAICESELLNGETIRLDAATRL